MLCSSVRLVLRSMYCLVTLRGFEHYTSHEPGDDRERWGGGGGGGGGGRERVAFSH